MKKMVILSLILSSYIILPVYALPSAVAAPSNGNLCPVTYTIHPSRQITALTVATVLTYIESGNIKKVVAGSEGKFNFKNGNSPVHASVPVDKDTIRLEVTKIGESKSHTVDWKNPCNSSQGVFEFNPDTGIVTQTQ